MAGAITMIYMSFVRFEKHFSVVRIIFHLQIVVKYMICDINKAISKFYPVIGIVSGIWPFSFTYWVSEKKFLCLI